MKRFYTLPILFLLVLVWACDRNDYFKDSGVHQAKFDGNMMEFFEARVQDSTSLFDTLITVIKLAGLEETIAKENITFFAPTDPSIGRSVKLLNDVLYNIGQDTIKELSEVDPRVWKKVLQGYMVEGNLGLVDFPQLDTLDKKAYGGRLYQTLDKDMVVNIGAVYHNLKNGDLTIPYAGPRQLLYSYIPDLSNPTLFWANAYVASSNHEPNNGRVHVLRYIDHIFGFEYNRFAELAIEYGIKYKDK